MRCVLGRTWPDARSSLVGLVERFYDVTAGKLTLGPSSRAVGH